MPLVKSGSILTVFWNTKDKKEEKNRIAAFFQVYFVFICVGKHGKYQKNIRHASSKYHWTYLNFGVKYKRKGK